MLAFQRNWNRYVVNSDGTWPDLARKGAARDQLANILVCALKNPTADEAGVFGNWVHQDNFGSSVVTHLLPDDLRAATPYLSPADLPDLHMREAFWPALIAASDPQLGAASTALAAGEIDSVVFEPSGEPYETTLRFRTIDDKWHSKDPRPFRINHNGLSFVRVSLEHHDTMEVSLILPGRPAIVRVDWIEAKVIAGGRQLDHAIRWETPDDFASLGYGQDSRWLGANMIEFDTPHAAISLKLAARAGAPVSTAQITVAFAMLPQSLSTLSPRLPSARRLVQISGRLRNEYRDRGARGIAAGAARVAMRKLGGPR
jgi:hypothetical protein